MRQLAIIFVWLCGIHETFARPALTDAQVKQIIIKQSVSDYRATGHPCACPYNIARNGSSCGRRSAYSRPGGASTLCYPGDITPDMISDWRAAHPG